MRKTLTIKLVVFLHQSMQQKPLISMMTVKEEQIQNEHVRRMFYDIPQVGNMIAARQMDFIGKVIPAHPDHPAQQMLMACCNKIRPVGCPFLHNKDYIIKNLCLLYDKVPKATINT
jgi:hypothetical protein